MSVRGFSDSTGNTGKIRAMIGLPQLPDNEGNAVSMYNCYFENEDNFIEKRMGVTMQSTKLKKPLSQINPGIGNQYGY
ncbi:MAG: hypothetical protein ACOCX0_01570 [Bacteroidota bacterium]